MRANIKKIPPSSIHSNPNAEDQADLPKILEEDYTTLCDLAQLKKSEDFGQHFRAMAPGMHELFSCKDTCKFVRKATTPAEKRRIIEKSHVTRMPTGWVGANVTLKDGTQYQVQHPTSISTNYHGAPITPKKRVSSPGSTSMHKRISDAADQKPTFQEAFDDSIAMNLNEFIQPPFVKNSVIKHNPNDMEAMHAFNTREKMKRMTSNFDSAITQPYNAPWYPQRDKRSVSPPRVFPSQRELTPQEQQRKLLLQARILEPDPSDSLRSRKLDPQDLLRLKLLQEHLQYREQELELERIRRDQQDPVEQLLERRRPKGINTWIDYKQE